MCLSLILVLAWGGGALAGNMFWDGGAGTTNWQDLANWAWTPDNVNFSDPVSLDMSTDFLALDDGNGPGGLISPVHITLGGNNTALIGMVRTYSVSTTVTIASGSQITVDPPWNGSQNGVPEYSAGYGSGGDHTLNVDGKLVLNNHWTDGRSPPAPLGKLDIGSGATGVVNVGSTGEVWLNESQLVIGTNGTLNIDGANQFYIEGDQTGDATYLGYISAGNKIYVGGSAAGVSMSTVDVSGTTYTTFVPEPTTVAILGLGSLVLLRRRR
jgi:hypothetical protein